MDSAKDREIEMLRKKLDIADGDVKILQLRLKRERMKLKEITDRFEEFKRKVSAAVAAQDGDWAQK